MKSSQLSPEISVPNIIFNLTILVFLASNVYSQTDSITDRQGNTYKTVLIGDQWWMAENLRTTIYANGEEIPHITNDSDWVNTNTGAYCYYDNTKVNIKLYGNLYNWYTIHDET